MIATVATRIAARLAERWPMTLMPFQFDRQPVRIFAYWHPSRDGDAVLAGLLTRIREVVAE